MDSVESTVEAEARVCAALPARRASLLAPLALLLAAGCGDGMRTAEGAADALVVSDLAVVRDDSILDVRDVFVDARNRLWVLSRFEPLVHVLDERGVPIRRFGRQGGGPAELRAAVAFMTGGGAGDGVAVWDAGHRQVVTLTDAGEVIPGVRLEPGPGRVVNTLDLSFGEPSRPARLGGGYVIDSYDTSVRRPADLWSGRLVLFDSSGATFREGSRFAEMTNRAPSDGTLQVFDAIPLWTTCEDGRLAVLNADSSDVRWFDAAGTPTRREPLPLPTVPVTEEDIRRYVAYRLTRMGPTTDQVADTTSPDARRAIGETLGALVAQLPRRAPPVRLRCDAYGRLWIQMFDTRGDPRGYGDTWLVLHEERLLPVRFPSRFVPRYFGRDRIAGVLTDTMDVTKAAWAAYPAPLARRR